MGSSNTKKPKILPLPSAPEYDTNSYDNTTKGQQNANAYETAKGAVTGKDPFGFSGEGWLTGVKDKILNYGPFSYDIDSDALYQQYKDKYIQQGRLAMEDTMGQAAAMTGGYGNSYAASVGNQAYQAQLDNLNDIVPELYQMALERYNMGKEDLYSQYGLLLQEYEREYGLYSDEYNKLLDKLGIARDDYYNGADMFYTEQNNKNTALGNQFGDAMAIWESNTANAWNEAEWDAENEDVVVENNNTGENDSKVPVGTSYDNGNLSDSQVKMLQKALGVEADGKYGPQSKKAAGGLSATEAYKKYVVSASKSETKGYFDYSNEDYNKNSKANGGSHYSDVLSDLKGMKTQGKSNKEVQAYLEELVGNSLITRSDYMSLYNKYRDGRL